MSREIKFRMWYDGKMYYPPGDFQSSVNSCDTAGDITDICPLLTLNGQWYIWGERQNCELMQFTGLLDKNGKEIYECDITKSDFGYSGVVELDSIHYAHGECTVSGNIEVIGNIYENPELLKQPA